MAKEPVKVTSSEPTPTPGEGGKALPPDPGPLASEDLGVFYPEEDLAEIEVAGQKIKVPKEAAELLTSTQKKNKELTEQVSQPPQTPVAPQTPVLEPVPGIEPTDDINEQLAQQLYDDPAGFIKGLTKGITESVSADLRKEYLAEESRKDIWTRFYDANPDLAEMRKDVHQLVESEMAINYNTLNNLPVEQSLEKLAEHTRARLLRLGRSAPTKVENNRTTVEGASLPNTSAGGTPSKDGEDDDKVYTLSDALREKMRRRKAKTA